MRLGIHQVLCLYLALAVLLDRAGQVGGIGRRLQLMDGLHEAVEGVQRPQHGVRSIAPGDHRVVGVVDHLIDDGIQTVAGIG